MIDTGTLVARRRALSDHIENNAVAIAGYEATQLSNDMAHIFRQQSAFLWLTGVEEPGWKYIELNSQQYLVQPDMSEVERLFDGGLTAEEATNISGIDAIISWEEAEKLLKQYSKNSHIVYTLGKDPYEQHYSFNVNPASDKLQKWLNKHFEEVASCWPQLKKLLAIKDKAGLDAINQAVDVSIAAFKDIYLNLQNFKNEYHIEADINRSFRALGAQGYAYETIVASEGNACTLHYVKNSAQLPKNGLVLIDAGALVDGYAADITRTYAIGTPTPRQVAVHSAVEKAHFAIIELIKPGLSFNEYHAKVDEIMRRALSGLGLLNSQEDYRKYFPHAISHGLGLDVHESLGGFKDFQVGMVLTVEPGIYIPEEGIGVRIEDDILVTETGNENLTAALSISL